MSAIPTPHELYLYLDYVPRPAEADLKWLDFDRECSSETGIEDEAWWINEGVKALKQTMAVEIARLGRNALHVVPLSGGCDSRVILGGLLENVPSSHLVAVTYGVPGAWDFEIPRLLTHKYGVQHEVIDLTVDEWCVDDLREAASCLRYPASVHQAYVRQKITKRFGADCVYWSGFMGDALSGSHLPEIPSPDARAAARGMLRQYATPHCGDQAFEEAVIDHIVTQTPWEQLAHRKLTLDQQVDFAFRQGQHMRTIVLPDSFLSETPFLHPVWVNFILNAPYKLLIHQRLYRRIIIEGYSSLAAFPCANTAGMPLSAAKYQVLAGRLAAKAASYVTRRGYHPSHPRTNYINWSHSLRHKSRLQDSVCTTLQKLKGRQILATKDIDFWWREHLDGSEDYATVLMNLSSLELLIEAGVM